MYSKLLIIFGICPNRWYIRFSSPFWFRLSHHDRFRHIVLVHCFSENRLLGSHLSFCAFRLKIQSFRLLILRRPQSHIKQLKP